MSVMDDVRHLAGWNDKQTEGYIIAFLHQREHQSLHAKYRTIFAQWRSNGDQIIGGSLGSACIFPSYQAAADAAAGWSNTADPGACTRIVKVKTRAAFEIFEDYPINLCDVLAEL